MMMMSIVCMEELERVEWSHKGKGFFLCICENVFPLYGEKNMLRLMMMMIKDPVVCSY